MTERISVVQIMLFVLNRHETSMVDIGQKEIVKYEVALVIEHNLVRSWDSWSADNG